MKNLIFLFVTTLCLILISCEKEPDFATGIGEIENGDFDVVTRTLPTINMGNASTPTPTGDTYSDTLGCCICEVTPMKFGSETTAPFLLDPQPGIIFPASLIDGNSIVTGGYRQLITDRAPLRLSVTLPTVVGAPSYIDLPDANFSTIENGINELLRDVAPNSTEAYIDFELIAIHNESQLKAALKGNVGGWGGKIEGSYSFESNTLNTKYLVRFTQKYYDIIMDAPAKPSDLFNELPDFSEFGGVSPVYVRSVSYGRMVYFMMESSYSKEEVRKTLSASFSKWKATAEVEWTKEEKEILENSSISALVIGGSASDAVKTFNGTAGLNSFILENAEFSVNNPGAPLSYSLHFLKDNSVFKLVLASQYNVRDCVEITNSEIKNLSPTGAAETYDGCPIKFHGDNEFARNGVNISGEVKLSISDDRKSIIAKIDLLFNESESDSHPGDTRAKVKDEIIAYELKEHGKKITAIISSNESVIDYTTNAHGQHDVPFTSDFLKKVYIQADGGGEDLPCVGYSDNPDGRAFVRMLFKDLKIAVD